MCYLFRIVLSAIIFGVAGASVASERAEATCEMVQTPQYAYLANMNDDTVSVLDISTMQTVDQIEGFDSPYGIVSMPDESRIYVDNASKLVRKKRYVAVVDSCTRKIVKKIPVSTMLPVSAITKDGSTVYVAEVATKHVLRVDTATDEIVRTYSVPELIAVAIPSHQNDTLWIGTIFGHIYTVSTDTGLTVGKPIKVPWSVGWLSFTPDGKKLISVHAGPGIVSVIDVATREVLASLDMGKGSFPEYGAVSPDGLFYWVALGNGKVKVIDLQTNSELITLEAGEFSFGVRLSPDGLRAFVTTVPHGSNLITENAAILTFLLLGGFWNPAGEIVIYDTTTFEEIDRVPTAASPTIMSYAGAEG